MPSTKDGLHHLHKSKRMSLMSTLTSHPFVFYLKFRNPKPRSKLKSSSTTFEARIDQKSNLAIHGFTFIAISSGQVATSKGRESFKRTVHDICRRGDLSFPFPSTNEYKKFECSRRGRREGMGGRAGSFPLNFPSVASHTFPLSTMQNHKAFLSAAFIDSIIFLSSVVRNNFYALIPNNLTFLFFPRLALVT